MARGYLLDKSYLDVLAEMVRWWRGNRYGTNGIRKRGNTLLPHQLARFELTADLTPGGTATAVRLVPDGSDWTDADHEHEVTVRDVLGTTRGKARTETLQGTRLYACKAHDHADWDVVSAQSWPLRIRGKLTAALATTDATFTIDGVTVMSPVGAIAVGHIIDGSGQVTVYNVLAHEGDNNGEVIAGWNEATRHWEVIQTECPA